MVERFKRYCKESEEGVGTIEVILILVVLIALVVIFREQILGMVGGIFEHINTSINSLY